VLQLDASKLGVQVLKLAGVAVALQVEVPLAAEAQERVVAQGAAELGPVGAMVHWPPMADWVDVTRAHLPELQVA